jgi:short subunit dehydrogenase-like uncharacterized protein
LKIGFTGRLIARYLNQHPEFASGAFTFSIAGRSVSKLHQLQEELGIDSGRVKIIEVDIGNEDSIDAAITTTRVVINAVGPFWKWARPVVRYVITSMFPRFSTQHPIELVPS